jgi:hypothetical protein
MNIGYVYKITNNVNEKLYIGQTTKPIKTRMSEHKSNRTRNGYRDSKLYIAMTEIGSENFNIEVIHTVYRESKKELREEMERLEKYYIEKLGTMINGYNSTTGGTSFAYDEETKKKMASQNQWKCVKVDVYTLDGKFIKTYDSYALASANLGVSAIAISNIATKRGRHRSLKGYRFANHGEKLTPYKISVKKHFAKYEDIL